MGRHHITVAALALTATLMTGVASATVAFVLVDDTAPLSISGASAKVFGDIKCTSGELFAVRVDVTQGSTFARGANAFVPCLGDVGTGANQDWQVNTDVLLGGPLVAGAATACYNARTKPSGGAVNDTEVGCEAVTLFAP